LYSISLRHITLLWTSDRPFADTSDNSQHSQETDIHALVAFEPAIPASERPKTHALDCARTGTLHQSYTSNSSETNRTATTSEFSSKIWN